MPYVLLCTSSSYMLTSIHLTQVAAPVWSPNGLRDQLVARGRKRLCTTAVALAKFQILYAQ